MEDLGYVRLLSRLFRFQATVLFIVILFFLVLVYSLVIPTFIVHFFRVARLRCRTDSDSKVLEYPDADKTNPRKKNLINVKEARKVEVPLLPKWCTFFRGKR